MPKRCERQAALAPHHLKRDPDDLENDEDDQRAADDHAIRLRLPDQVGGGGEKVDREGERERRNDQVGAQRLATLLFHPWPSAASGTRWRARSCPARSACRACGRRTGYSPP